MIFCITQGGQKWSERLKKWTKYSNIRENTEIIWYLEWKTLASITLWHLRLHEEMDLLISCQVNLSHSSWMAFHNCSVVLGFLALERSPSVFHAFPVGLRSALWGGQSIPVTFSALRKFLTTIALWHGALSCMNMKGCLVEFLKADKNMIFHKLFINSCIYLSL